MALRANTALHRGKNTLQYCQDYLYSVLMPRKPQQWNGIEGLIFLLWSSWPNTKTVDADNLRVKALFGDIAGEAAEKKVVTLLVLSLGESARKMFKDKYPELSVWTFRAQDIIERFVNCFLIAQNSHKFLSRKQEANEAVRQFWRALNGLDSRCEMVEIAQTLVHGVFILNMNNRKVLRKPCLAPYKNHQDALQHAISYEEGIMGQKSMGMGVANG